MSTRPEPYEAELGKALGELSDRIHAFSRGPARELWQRYNAGLDDRAILNWL